MTTPKKKPTRAKRPKTATVTAIPALIPRPDGRGALLAGGVPGNRGGVGAVPSEVKARALGSFDQRIPVLEEIADNAAAAASDRISAVDKLGKYGLGDGISRGDVRAALAETLDVVRASVAPDVAETILAAIRPHWKKL